MELMTKREVADLLKVCQKTVENLVRRGLLPRPIYVGRLPRWHRSEIERSING